MAEIVMEKHYRYLLCQLIQNQHKRKYYDYD